jgi:hypothetical protein
MQHSISTATCQTSSGFSMAGVADADTNQTAATRAPLLMHVIHITEGAWGALGRPVRFREINNYVTTGAVTPS